MSQNENEQHYGRGTAAGFKGCKQTGKDAASAVTETLGARHALMMEAFQPYGEAGATCFDIAADLDLGIDLVRPRVCELEKRKLLHVVGRSMGPRGKEVTRHSVVKPDGEAA